MKKKLCYDEKSLFMLLLVSNDNSNKEMMVIDAINCNDFHVLKKENNCHNNKLKKEESDNEKLISNLKTQIKDELEKH